MDDEYHPRMCELFCKQSLQVNYPKKTTDKLFRINNCLLTEFETIQLMIPS